MLDKFLHLEKSIAVLQKSSAWKYLRIRLYNNFYHPVSFKKRHNQSNFLKKTFQQSIFFRLRNLTFNKIVITHPRVSNCQNEYFCKYTDNHIDDTTLVIGYSDKLVKSPYNNIISMGVLKLFVRLFLPLFIIKSIKEIIHLNKQLNNEETTPNKISFSILETLRLSQSYSLEYLFRFLLIMLRVKKVYATVAYGDDVYPCLVACRKQNIVFTEIQHGVIDLNHFGYVYSEKQILSGYFPQNMLVWSKYWIDKIRIKNYINFGFTNPKYCISQELVEIKNRILIIGQAHVQEELLRIATKIINQTGDYFNILYRPHPSELSFSSELNIEVDKNKLEESLQTTEYVLGVDSTVLIEAAHFNLKVVQYCLKNSYNYSDYENIVTFDHHEDIVNYFKNISSTY